LIGCAALRGFCSMRMKRRVNRDYFESIFVAKTSGHRSLAVTAGLLFGESRDQQLGAAGRVKGRVAVLKSID